MCSTSREAVLNRIRNAFTKHLAETPGIAPETFQDLLDDNFWLKETVEVIKCNILLENNVAARSARPKFRWEESDRQEMRDWYNKNRNDPV